MTEDLQKLITTWLPSPFNPNITACRALLAEFKSRAAYTIEGSPRTVEGLYAIGLQKTTPEMCAIFGDFVYHIREVELRDGTCPFELVYELEKSVRRLAQEGTPRLSSDVEAQIWNNFAGTGCQSFRDYAARQSLKSYLQWLPEELRDKRQTQSYFLQALCIHHPGSQPLDTEAIRYFLELGADPNYALQEDPPYTVWGCFLATPFICNLIIWPGQKTFSMNVVGCYSTTVLSELSGLKSLLSTQTSGTCLIIPMESYTPWMS
jgi:hypothetical protein